MTASDTVLPLSGLDYSTVEKTLAALRRAATQTPRAESDAGTHTARTGVHNLIVCTPTDAARTKVGEAISTLSGRHTSRILFFPTPLDGVTTESNGPPVEAMVASYCLVNPNHQGQQVCCEEVTITARGDALNHLPELALPLLVPDLPVFLWWTGTPPFESAMFHRLYTLSDRLIVDSLEFAQVPHDLPRLYRTTRANQLRGSIAPHSVGDLGWARLTPWRELTAQLFDVPRARAGMPYLDHLTVGFAAPQDGTPARLSSTALLLAGWVTGRLGWRLIARPPTNRPDRLQAYFQRPDGGVATVDVVAEDAVGRTTTGRVASLTMHSQVDGMSMDLAVRRDDAGHVRSTIATADYPPIERTANLAILSDGLALARELTILDRDALYDEALEQAARMVDPATSTPSA